MHDHARDIHCHTNLISRSWIIHEYYSWNIQERSTSILFQNYEKMHECAWPCMCMSMHDIFTAILTSFPMHEGFMNTIWTFDEQSCTLFMHMPWTVHEQSCIFCFVFTGDGSSLIICKTMWRQKLPCIFCSIQCIFIYLMNTFGHCMGNKWLQYVV